MTERDVVEQVLSGRSGRSGSRGSAFAPANIALCKYWGKRNRQINLPVTGSLSIALGSLGAQTEIIAAEQDEMLVNGKPARPGEVIFDRSFAYLDLFRTGGSPGYRVETTSTVPIGAGLASSASGFAALVMALDALHGWELPPESLSILARLGSGSACRSVYPGFVEWQCGSRDDGMDCFAAPLPTRWTDLRIGLITVSGAEKPVGSTRAMIRTVEESCLYRSWPDQVAEDLPVIREAVTTGEFSDLGPAAECNALAMHATMLACNPAICYWLPGSLDIMQRIWKLRDDGLEIYFTMDAGPNVKVLYCKELEEELLSEFDSMVPVDPFQETPGT